MTELTARQIRDRRHKIDAARREMQRKLMLDYDRNVYVPARRQLAEDCAKLGHGPERPQDNGLGSIHYYCTRCFAPIRSETYPLVGE